VCLSNVSGIEKKARKLVVKKIAARMNLDAILKTHSFTE
jgi:hypothetical protein